MGDWEVLIIGHAFNEAQELVDTRTAFRNFIENEVDFPEGLETPRLIENPGLPDEKFVPFYYLLARAPAPTLQLWDRLQNFPYGITLEVLSDPRSEGGSSNVNNPDGLRQGYLSSTKKGGVGLEDVADKPSSVCSLRWIVVGKGWTSHSDLPTVREIVSINPPSIPSGHECAHGNGMLGILCGQGGQIRGFVPGAREVLFARYRSEGHLDNLRDSNIVESITSAVAMAEEGDVLVVAVDAVKREYYLKVGSRIELKSNGGRVGLEAWSLLRQQFVAATSKGVYVIIAAGNGNNELVDGWCTRFEYPSGALVVGAGRPNDRRRIGVSNAGRRIDMHSWGEGVLTLGLGNGIQADFNGTSSATAIVAGAAGWLACYAAKVQNNWPRPQYLWALMRRSGFLWTDGIGPRPDIPEAVRLMNDPSFNWSKIKDEWTPWSV